MPLKLPDSMDECIYFTRRNIDNGEITAWVYRKECPKCKTRMGKPIKKNGKVDKKASYYECPKCKYQEDNQAHEESLNLEIIYTCPHCQYKGEATTEHKRTSFHGVKAYVFECGKCNKKIGITKKLKKTKR